MAFNQYPRLESFRLGRAQAPYDYTGGRFGSLVAVECLGRNDKQRLLWKCRCDCGNECIKDQKALINTTSSSCCEECKYKRIRIANTTHGQGGASKKTRSLEYGVWSSMLTRCRCPATKQWKDYGGRGISVCQRWTESFADFMADMGPKPSSRHTLDRIDYDGNYEPGNCRWATWKDQLRNTSRNVRYEIRGEVMTIAEAVERFNIVAYNTVRERISRGWSPEDAVFTPAKSFPGSG